VPSRLLHRRCCIVECVSLLSIVTERNETHKAAMRTVFWPDILGVNLAPICVDEFFYVLASLSGVVCDRYDLFSMMNTYTI